MISITVAECAKKAGGRLNRGCLAGLSLEDHIKDVLEQLDKNEAVFIELTRLHAGCMQLVGYFRDRYPGLNFEGELVAGLAKYRLSVDFDFYFPDGT